ncbi:MAG: ABC transporter ATP-binding protein [Planctomycetia bacterium]|nr:ABC transporter ATP-binding protein [Planctomycetia bacterium]
MLGYETTFFTQRGIADATTRFTSDMGTLSNGLVLAYGKALREPMKLIVCLIGALLVSWQLLLFTFLFVPVAFILIRWLAKSLKRVVRRAMAEMAQLYGRIDETFRAIRVVKSFNRESFEEDKFAKVNSAYYRRGMKTAKYDALTSPLTETLGIGMLVIAIIAGSYLIIYQKTSLGGIPIASRPLDLGSLALFYGFLIGASDPARRLSDIFTSMQGACAAADRVYEVIDREVVIENSSDPKPLKKFEDSIVFDKVGYAYPVDSSFSLAGADARKRKKFEDVLKEGIHSLVKFVCRKKNSKATDEQASGDISTPSVEQHRVLHEASLEIKRGETIAIVGRSGCGKSTLLSMIPRFIDPTEGRVLVDGIPIKEIALSDLRDQIGLVAQDSVLFNDTVYENIRYGRLTATREEIIQAAKDAYADDFICHELINGYDTVVGPGGGALSGGQRQRIALARALLKDPQIFLLDEATSQIDLESERFIHEALKKFVGSRTTILITHRLTAIQLADRVVVMDDGRILFVGTHEEALKNSPFYQTLWKNELT